MIERLLLFGATDDLAGRFLLPALAALCDEGRLPDGFRVVGAALEDWDDETFQRHVAQRLDQHAACDVSAAAREALVRSGASPSRPGTADGRVRPGGRRADAVGLPQGSRIVLEKPFGDDLESAVKLNRLLRQVAGVAGEQAVFRVDHALGMATVQNLLAARLANRVQEPLWSNTHMSR